MMHCSGISILLLAFCITTEANLNLGIFNETCHDTCSLACQQNCEHPITCTEKEKECGEEPVPIGSFCTAHKICVPSNCACT